MTTFCVTLNKSTQSESSSHLKSEILFSIPAFLKGFDTVSNVREQNHILVSVYFSPLGCSSFIL